MKNSFISVTAFFLAFLLLFSGVTPCLADTAEPEINAKAAILMDAANGNILYEQNGTTPLYVAGLTMMMTALLTAEKVEQDLFSYDDVVTVSGSAYFDVTSDAATQGLKSGEELTLMDLLRCALVGGGSDACNAIADYLCGSISSFVAEMNQRARELGCENTCFVNTHGLPNDSNYSTALDMAKIAAAFTQHETLMEVVNTTTYDVPATNLSDVRHLTSGNYILRTDYTRYYYSYACGIKSGYTDDAGYCLASSMKNNGSYVVSIVLGCEVIVDESGFTDIQSFIQTKNLFKWFNDRYSLRSVVSNLEPIIEIPVDLGEGTDTVVLCSRESLELFLPNDLNISDAYTRHITIYSAQDGAQPLTAPITQGTVLGQMTVSDQNGELYGPFELVANTDIAVSRVELMRQRFSGIFHSTWFLLCFWGIILILVAYFTFITLYRIRRVKEKKRKREARSAENRKS